MTTNAISGSPSGLDPTAKPRTREDAARQFEAVLVRQFVQVMTKDLFKSSLAGEGGLDGGQADLQRDVLTDSLTEHLVDSGALSLSDLLLRQWARQDAAAPSPPTAPTQDEPSI